MPTEFTNLINSAKNWWNSLQPGQKTGLIITGLVVALLGGGIFMWATTPDYKPLFSNLSDADSAKIVKKLDDDKVPYKLDKATGAVMVAENMLMQERIKIAGSGMSIGGGVGFELFDKVNFGMSDEERKINYQRALQTELERTIDNIPGIEKSRVHLSIPDQKLFDDEQPQAKASIYLKLKSGVELKKEQILGIQNLIASSVERLGPEGVAVISTDGKILTEFSRGDSDISDKKLELTTRVEDYYRNKIQSFLDNIVGAGNSTVRVSAALQFNKVEKARESYTPPPQPQQAAVKSEDSTSEGVAPSNGAMVTTNSGVPPAQPVVRQKKAVNYELNRESEKTVVTPGDVKGVTVAVVLNGKFDEKYIDNLKQSIAAAVGINIKNGDVIDIKAMEFKASISEEETAKIESLAQRDFYLNLAKDYMPAVVLVVIGIFFAVNMGKGVQVLSKGVFTPMSHDSGNGNGNGNGNGHNKNLKPEEILKMARENPKEAAKVIKSWIS